MNIGDEKAEPEIAISTLLSLSWVKALTATNLMRVTGALASTEDLEPGAELMLMF